MATALIASQCSAFTYSLPLSSGLYTNHSQQFSLINVSMHVNLHACDVLLTIGSHSWWANSCFPFCSRKQLATTVIFFREGLKSTKKIELNHSHFSYYISSCISKLIMTLDIDIPIGKCCFVKSLQFYLILCTIYCDRY